MKVIVLSNTKYKENDIIYNAISEEGYVSFKVSGGMSPKSPMVWLNNPLTIAEVEFGDKRFKYPSIKEAKFISSSMSFAENFDKIAACGVITEAAIHLVPDEEKHLLFKDVEEALDALKKVDDFVLVTLIYLARVIQIAGSKPEVDKCVFCGSTSDIVAFSFVDGGFICRNCLRETEVVSDLTPTQMRLIRYIFKSPNYSCINGDKYSQEDKIIILKHLREYISDDLGVQLKSISALIN